MHFSPVPVFLKKEREPFAEGVGAGSRSSFLCSCFKGRLSLLSLVNGTALTANTSPWHLAECAT